MSIRTAYDYLPTNSPVVDRCPKVAWLGFDLKLFLILIMNDDIIMMIGSGRRNEPAIHC